VVAMFAKAKKKRGVSDCMAVVRKKETSLCDFRGRSILVGFKKI
jgi:hypothetical protein